MKRNTDKCVRIDPDTHEQMKRVAVEHGINLSQLISRVCDKWAEGEVFFLPASLRKGKASARQ